MEKKKSNRGGKRPGAGRKKEDSATRPENESRATETKPIFEPLPQVTDANKDQMKVCLPIKTKKLTRGVVIIALGSEQYGRMAANAAASIRFADKHTPIHLVYSGRSLAHLTAAHKALFSSMEECADEYMTKDGKTNYIKAKTCIYELSPFDETLLIDADLLWFAAKPVCQLMQSLSAVDFTMQSRGYFDYKTSKGEGSYTHWCNVLEAKRAYGLKDKIHQLSSEVVWFRKTAQTKKLFTLIRQIYDKPKLKASFEFRGDIPDELAYNIASAKLEIYPRNVKEVFIFWDLMDKTISPSWSGILQDYYGYSVGGNSLKPSTILRYEQMAKAHANALRLPHHFKLFQKRNWDKSRTVI